MTKTERLFKGFWKIRVTVRKDTDRDEEVTDYYLSDDPISDSFAMKVSIYSYIGRNSIYYWGQKKGVPSVLRPLRQIEDLRTVLEEMPFVKGDR